METRIFSSLSRNVGVTDDFSSFFGSPPRANGFVTYTAGTGSFATATTGYDDAVNELRSFGGGWIADARARLTIAYEVIPNIVISALAGSNIKVSASASNYRSPLTYKWWRNGALSGVTSSNFSTAGPASGTSVTYKVEITDADGDKGTHLRTITGASPGGGGGGGGGGGCLILHSPDSLTTNRPVCP